MHFSDDTKSTNFGQKATQNLSGKATEQKTKTVTSATKGLSSEEKKGGSELDTRMGITGLNKGGLMATPKKKAKRQHKKGGLANKK